MTMRRPVSDPGSVGIAPPHWHTIVGFAQLKGYVVCLRAGKRAAVRWIERGFPAKPLQFKTCKVDPDVGLLIARTPEQREEAWRGGYAVLVKRSERPQAFEAVLSGGYPAFGRDRFDPTRHEWACEHLVLDRATRQPITSDYDIAAVVDTRAPDYNLTYASWVGGPNRTNPYIVAISAELNALFGSQRIMHGTEAQYSGSLAHGDNEGIVVFRPTGAVQLLTCPSQLDTDRELHRIMLEYFPSMGPVFQQ